LALCERTFRIMKDGVRHQFLHATPEEVSRILRERLAAIRAFKVE
jgi:hypothetical protein